jgi:alpha-L-arabinofuranosidase
MNLYHRHGARVRMTTGADFAGTRWTVNAVLIQVPRGLSYLTPVASIMRLYKRHNGAHGVAVKAAPQGLDLAASRTGDRVFLHVANLQYHGPVEASFSVEGRTIAGGRVFEIAPEDPRLAVGPEQPDVFAPKEKPLVPGSWRFPARSVSAVELNLAV